jgi:RNA-directed DNA polymerase
VPGNIDPWDEVRDMLNRSLLGWLNYFSFGTRSSAYRVVDHHVYERVRDFLARRHKVAGPGTRRFPSVNIHSCSMSDIAASTRT